MQIRHCQQYVTRRAWEDAHCCCVPLYLHPPPATCHTHTALPNTPFLAAVCHIFFLERTHAWWDHTPGPGAGLYYVWVGLSSRCLVSIFAREAGRCPVLSAADRAVSEVWGRQDWEAPLRSGGLVQVRCGLPGWCAGSQSGSASDKLPTEVSCANGEAEQRGEERVEQHTCPHCWEGQCAV